jgi:hypothetical protein
MLTGDYNQNGVVDAADYVLWRDTLAESVANGTGADGNADGTINDEDYAVWRSQFGKSVSESLASNAAGSNSAVPEPGTSLLLFLAVCLGPVGRGTLRPWTRRS